MNNDNKHTIGALEGFLHDVWEGESELQDIFNVAGYNELKYIVELAKKAEEYEKAYDYINKAIYTQHCTMNHIQNTEYEQGQITGLIIASNIVKKALKKDDAPKISIKPGVSGTPLTE